MTLPTEAQIKDQIAKACDIFHEIYNFGSINTPNYVTLEDTFIQALRGEHVASAAAAIRAVRGGLGSSLSPGRVRAVLEPMIVELAKVYEIKVSSGFEAFQRLYSYMHANSLSVNARGFTFGTPGSFSGTGTGTIHRLNKDRRGYDIEIGLAEDFVAECSADQLSTGVHAEQFEFRTQAGSIDALERRGTNTSRVFSCPTGFSSLARNPSFSQGTSGVSVPDWTLSVGTAANTAKDSANYYRSSGNGDTTPYGLNLTASIRLTQNCREKGITFDPSVPYFLQVAWNRQVGTASGTLTLALGSKTTSVVVAAQTGWQVLYLPITYLNCWPDNFMQDNMTMYIDWAKTAGNLLIDDVMLVPMQAFRGQWYMPIGGATPFIKGDKFSWSDSIATDAIIQFWLAHAFSMYLPHNAAGAETWVDP